MTNRIQHSNYSSSQWFESASESGIRAATPQVAHEEEEKFSQSYWSFYTDFNIPVWKRALGGVLLPVMGPLTLFGVGCADEARSKIPVEDSGLVPDGGVPNDGSPVAIENHPPVWDSIADQQLVEGASFSLRLSARDPDDDTLTYIPDTLPRGAGLTAEGRFNWTPDFDQAGEYEVGVRVSDGKEEVSTKFNVEVKDTNRLPVIEPIPSQTIQEGERLRFLVRASDPEETPLQLSASRLPSGAIFDPGTGLFEWRPNYEQAGRHEITFHATDEENTVDTRVVIEVVNTNQAPIFDPISVQIVNEDENLSFQVSAMDPDGDAVAIDVSADTLPEGAQFENASGTFSWTPNYDQAGVYKVKFVAADGQAVSEYLVTIQVRNTNRLPEIEPIPDQTVMEGEELVFNVVAHDPDGQDVGVRAVNLPSGVFFDEGTGLFSWTPDFDQAGEHEVEFEGTDGEDTVTRTVRIAVENTNRPPVIVPIPDQMVAEGGMLAFGVSAIDPDGDPIQWSANDVPEESSFDPVTGIFDWSPNFEQAGNYQIEFRATDGELTTAEDVGISVQNTNRAPVFDPIPDQTVAEGEELRFVVSAGDPDGQQVVKGINNLPDGAQFNAADGVFSWVPTYDQSGNYQVEFTASDGETAVVQSLLLNVTNINRPPVIDPIPDQVVAENQGLQFVVTARDVDGDPVQLGANFLPAGARFDADTGVFTWTPGFDQAGEYDVELEATDGLVTTARSVRIAVENTNRPPVIAPVPDFDVAEGAQLVFGVSASDPDDDPVQLGANNIPEGAFFDPLAGTFDWTPNYEQAGEYQIEFRATDGAADVTRNMTITVQNTNRSPIFEDVLPQAVREGEELRFVVSASDPDGGPVQLGANLLPDGASFDAETGTFTWVPRFDQAGNYMVEFTASDGEVTSSQLVLITVEDANRAPVFDPIPDHVVAEGSTLRFVVSAISPEGLDVHLGVAGLPRGSNFNSETGEFEWMPNYDQAGEYEVEFIATSGEVASTETIWISVQNVNQPPVFDPIPEQHAMCGEGIRFVVFASEPDGDAVEIGAELLPEGSSFDPQNHQFDWIPGVGQGGHHVATFWARSGEQRVEYVVNISVDIIDLISRSSSGEVGNTDSRGGMPSSDGRFVTFSSRASNLVFEDSSHWSDIFVRDRTMGITERVNVNLNRVEGDGDSGAPSISGDGRVVVFSSDASNWGVGNGRIYLVDRATGILSALDLGWDSRSPEISADGRFVAFESGSTDLVFGDNNRRDDIFVYDRETGAVERVSVSSGGEEANADSVYSAINSNGRFVVFASAATNLVPENHEGIFIHDRESQETELVSVGTNGLLLETFYFRPQMSTDGRFVAFTCNLGGGIAMQTCFRDRELRTTENVSLNSNGEGANRDAHSVSMSGDARFVAFTSYAANLVPADNNDEMDIFVRDRRDRTTARVNISLGGDEANDYSSRPELNANGRYIIFTSHASNLVPGDVNRSWDIFLVSLACFFDLDDE